MIGALDACVPACPAPPCPRVPMASRLHGAYSKVNGSTGARRAPRLPGQMTPFPPIYIPGALESQAHVGGAGQDPGVTPKPHAHAGKGVGRDPGVALWTWKLSQTVQRVLRGALRQVQRVLTQCNSSTCAMEAPPNRFMGALSTTSHCCSRSP